MSELTGITAGGKKVIVKGDAREIRARLEGDGATRPLGSDFEEFEQSNGEPAFVKPDDVSAVLGLKPRGSQRPVKVRIVGGGRERHLEELLRGVTAVDISGLDLDQATTKIAQYVVDSLAKVGAAP